jgi:hypothetical protein
MALVYKDRVKETTTTTGTGTLTLAGAATGYQAFSAIGNGNTCIYAIEDANGTAWEVGIGTYTASGTTLARTTILASSTGSAISLSAGTHSVFVTAEASRMQSAYEGHSAIVPGGRLTLTTAVPVTTSDVTGATTVYYTPYVHDRIALWSGAYWQVIQFAETSHALGTVTSGKNYDVFGYLDSGALALEKLVWTNDTSRATAITLQDGRYCKSGDKTRLYLGTFRSTSTTQTEDSAGGTTSQAGGKRFLWNAYNRVKRDIKVFEGTDSWTYNTAAWRLANAATVPSNCCEFVIGIASDNACAKLIQMAYASSGYGHVGIGYDATNARTGFSSSGYANAQIDFAMTAYAYVNSAPGYHYFSWIEYGGGATFTRQGDNNESGLRQSGLIAEVFS